MDVAAQGIRYAAHGLVAAWADHDRLASSLLERAGEPAAVVARIVAPVRPGGPALAATVVTQVDLGVEAAAREFAAVAEVFSAEVRSLLALLFADPALALAATVLPPPGSGLAGILGTFPPGPPRDYVEHILTDHPSSWGMPVRDAAAAAVTGPTAPLAAVVAVASQFEPELRADVARMFLHQSSHAIQVHGPGVSDEALQARISWRKDPAGRTTPQHRWTLHPDDTVSTEHRVKEAAGRFDSFEALAKPLVALVDANGGTIAGLNAYLRLVAPQGQARIFVPAEVAGLGPGETTGFRGAGARSDDMARHWAKARDYAMDTGAAPMPVVTTDQIADGSDPGAAIIFRKIGTAWVVTTCYPIAAPPKNFTRFGGSTP